MSDPQAGISETPAAPVESAPSAPRTQLRTIFIVFLVVFIDLLGFGIILPLLPRYGEEFLDPLIAGGKESRLGGVILGLLMASFSAMQFLVSPLLGKLSDRHGRRAILLLGLAGSMVFYIVFGIASELGSEGWLLLAVILLFVARIGGGIAGATLGTALAAIADATSEEGRSRSMAVIGIAFGLGFTFGPLLGVAALDFMPGFRGGTGFLAAACSLVALVLGFVLLPETRRPGSQDAHEDFWRGLRSCLSKPSIMPLIVVFFIASFSFAGFESSLPLLTKDALGFSEKTNFLMFSYVGIVLMLSQGGLYQVLSRKFPLQELKFMLAGVVLMGLGIGGIAAVAWFSPGPEAPESSALVPPFLIALASVSVGFAFLIPSTQSLLSRRSDLSQQGEVLGVNQSASALARIMGPVVGLSLYRFPPAHVLPNALGTVLMALVVVLTLRTFKK